MSVGWLIACVILVILLVLLLFPLRAKMAYDETFHATVKLLCFTVVRIPSGRAKKPKKPAAKAGWRERIKRKGGGGAFRGLDGFLRAAKLAKTALGEAGRLLRHVHVRDIQIHLIVSGEDAASAAIRYGQVCAAVYPLLAAASKVMPVRSSTVDIRPDFTGEKNLLNVSLSLWVLPVFLLAAALRLGVRIAISLLKKGANDSSSILTNKKGGAAL